MTESIRRIGLAKTVVDRGFSAVGPKLDPADPQVRVLMLLSCRAVAVANAVMILARHNHACEALPLLRSLLELAAHARWVAQEDGARRAREFLAEQESPRWDGLWPESRLARRGSTVGMPAELGERVQGWCRAHMLGNASGLPWAHVFSGSEAPTVSSEEALSAAAQLMAEVVKALDGRWPGDFPLEGLQER